VSDERGQSKAALDWGCIAVLLMLLACLTPLIVIFWFPFNSVEPHRDTSQVQPVSLVAAEQIAIAEVKRREGWSGKADLPVVEGRVYVVVRRKPGPTSDWRYVEINWQSKEIVRYEVRTDPLP
jgi:hypothetical protein